MYFNSQPALAARLATIDHCHQASGLVFDSTAQLVDLYCQAGRHALGLARGGEPLPAVCRQIIAERHVPDFFRGHLRIAGHAHEGLVRLFEAQLHAGSRLAQFALEKTALMSPPMVELALDAAESIVVVGEAAADELGDASLHAIAAVEDKLDHPVAPRRTAAPKRNGARRTAAGSRS